jgi:hypothetical protein
MRHSLTDVSDKHGRAVVHDEIRCMRLRHHCSSINTQTPVEPGTPVEGARHIVVSLSSVGA